MTRAASDTHARLLAACAESGCPVCRFVDDASRRALAALLHEQVTDVETRRRLRRAGGFCAGHATMLRELPGAAFGAAILHEDLLRLAIERFERLAGRTPDAGSRRGWLARLGGGTPAAAAPRTMPADRCPVCADAAGAETRAVDTLLRLASDTGLRTAYAASDGVCVPHLALAVERGRTPADTAPLLDATLARWKAVRAALARFIARHDHRNREPVAREEAQALGRALATLRGGLAGGDPADIPHPR